MMNFFGKGKQHVGLEHGSGKVGPSKSKEFEKKWKANNSGSHVLDVKRDLKATQIQACESSSTCIERRESLSDGKDNVPKCEKRNIKIDPRMDKFQIMLSSPSLKMEDLKKLCWNGIPDDFRTECWRLLLGYTPLVRERWEETITTKRHTYWATVPLNLTEGGTSTLTDYERTIYHQIHADVLRTSKSVPLFQIPSVKSALERILYLWAIRHPASGYVQGINDLVTPFYAVFLQPHINEPIDEINQISHIQEEILKDVEADCYWCLTKFIDSIQDNYTFAQPGIQKMLFKMKEIVNNIDGPINKHLAKQKIEYIQFAFRWMNCLLMRELPLKAIIRMWDTYLSEDDCFAVLHVYVCSAFLVKWSDHIVTQEFQEGMIFLQNLPTKNWGIKEVEVLLSQAYIWKTLYNDSVGHMKSIKH